MQSLGLKYLAPKIASHPGWVATITLAVTLLSLWLTLTRTEFTGDITENLRNNSETYQAFQALEDEFHSFSNDETLLIRSTDLGSPEDYQALAGIPARSAIRAASRSGLLDLQPA